MQIPPDRLHRSHMTQYTAEATASWSTTEDTVRVHCSYCMQGGPGPGVGGTDVLR